MRPIARSLTRFSALVLAFTALACQNSETVTGPPNSVAAPSGSVTGSWSGTYQSDDMASCGRSSASATFEQIGATITGSLVTSSCGVGGRFVGTLQGNTLYGKVEQAGCVGGEVSGTINGSELTLAVSDLTKPLITFDNVILAGGVVILRR